MSNRPRDWTLLSKQALVLVYVDRHPNARIRDIARELGVTERSVHNLVHDLVEEGYLSVTKRGRRNVYVLNRLFPLRHHLVRNRTVEQLLVLLNRPPARSPGDRPRGQGTDDERGEVRTGS